MRVFLHIFLHKEGQSEYLPANFAVTAQGFQEMG